MIPLYVIYSYVSVGLGVATLGVLSAMTLYGLRTVSDYLTEFAFETLFWPMFLADVINDVKAASDKIEHDKETE